MINTLRDLANWIEAVERGDLYKIIPGITTDDLKALFRYVMPTDGTTYAPQDQGEIEPDEKGKHPQQGFGGMPVKESKKEKKKRKIKLSRDVVRDARYARALREISNNITHWSDTSKHWVPPLVVMAVASVIFNRVITLFSQKSDGVFKMQQVENPRANTQLPVSVSYQA